MKVPLLAIHVLSSRELSRRLEIARGQEREFTNKQISRMLNRTTPNCPYLTVHDGKLICRKGKGKLRQK